ncbi:hypothetical protein [Microbacterium sp. Se63.02b]|uniref:hypothetical protein n=1 Tax=Microbacterium sp. Se63.02b TaxID=2709304 RepID=UPI0031F6FB87
MAESSSSPADAVASAPLADRAVDLARRWVIEAAAVEPDPAAARLAGVLQDANGLPFTLGFVDGVMRPESLSAAASRLHRIAPIVPEFLPWYLRSVVRLGGESPRSSPRPSCRSRAACSATWSGTSWSTRAPRSSVRPSSGSAPRGRV